MKHDESAGAVARPAEPPAAPREEAPTAALVPPWMQPLAERAMASLERFANNQSAEISADQEDTRMSYAHAKESQQELTRRAKHRLVFGAYALALVAALVVTGMALNKDALVGDIVKIGLGMVAGAAGMYGIKNSRRDKDDEG